jgi:organic radical activating enzyme
VKPNKNNFCGGNFQDWLEVNLIDICNGKCSWCIETNGYHPTFHASWEIIVQQSLESKKTNIILLGGEPTLYKDLEWVIRGLYTEKRKVWVTTNGSLLSPDFVFKKLDGLTGINISIHSYDLQKNKEITGIQLNDLKETISALHKINANVRLNCNCILGHIDSKEAIDKYVLFAKEVGADKVRFAELKQEDESFIDLAKVLEYKYDLNDDPFIYGCNSDTSIHGIPVNFRQMCGLQTSRRSKPENPDQCLKSVLYYDGKFYNGWQTKGTVMNKFKFVANSKTSVSPESNENLTKLLKRVANGTLSVEDAVQRIKKEQEKIEEKIKKLSEIDKSALISEISNLQVQISSSSGGCAY